MDNVIKIGTGPDPPSLDDIVIKEGRFGALDPYGGGDPTSWWVWPEANDSTTFTADVGEWRVHYKAGWPICFYHQRKFVLGLRVPGGGVRIDHRSRGALWAWIGNFRVVLESGDPPRLEIPQGEVGLSTTPMPGGSPNTWELGNGYCISSTRKLRQGGDAFVAPERAWIMVGTQAEEAEISARVLALKVYDGPHKYSARGSDLRLVDPVPLPSEAEYAIYSYDDEGLRGLYRLEHEGIPAYRKGFSIEGEELAHRAVGLTGDLRFDKGRIKGAGSLRYSFPLLATKLKNLFLRGQEVDAKISCDGGPWTEWKEYDGLACRQLEVEVSIYDSLSALRLEWEGLQGWEPVGRPRVDVVPSGWQDEQGEGTLVRMAGRLAGEGLLQTNDLYIGEHTASANVRCHRGQAILAVGGYEVVNWPALDKSIRAGGRFLALGGKSTFVLTGRGESGFEYDIDRFRIAEGAERTWVKQDISWVLETEGDEYEMSDTINRPGRGVSVGETRSWRMRIRAPEDLGDQDKIVISHLKAEVQRTGRTFFQRVVEWSGEGASRLYYPRSIVNQPEGLRYYKINGKGSLLWEEETLSSAEDDVRIRVAGSGVSHDSEQEIYLDAEVLNELWRIEIEDDRANVYLNNLRVGTMLGKGTPFKIASNNPEDVRLDCPAGFVQMRRGLGPRFQGWDLTTASVPASKQGATVAWGTTLDESKENLPFYAIVTYNK